MSNLEQTSPPAEIPSILFIDDEPSILMAVRVVFRKGYQVTVTTDGFEAIELLKTKKFHVVVSDQRMPTITGIEVLKRAKEIAPNTVRILLTGYSDADAIVGAINDVEVHRFLQKPWDNTKLKQVIDSAIELAVSISQGTSQSDSAPVPSLAKNLEIPVVEASPDTATAVPAHSSEADDADKETVLVVDAKSTLFAQTQTEMADKVNVLHASALLDVFRILEATPVSIVVCAFDVQSEADRTFLQLLKKEHPYIFVIAVCDSTDSTRLIELINQAKVFRFAKKPVGMALLSRYISSALTHVKEVRQNPVLIRKQEAEALSESVAASSSAQLLQGHFSRINQSLTSRFAKFASFFRHK